MDGKRVAVVVSHPAHLLTVVGMLQRWRPHVLILYRAVVGAGAGQERAIRAAIEPLGAGDRLASFAISESESFERALAGDFAFHADIGARVFDWLRAVRPDAMLGDAYEAYNFHHDVTRLLLDNALRRGVFGRAVANYEFPLSCRLDEPGAPVRYGTFAFGSSLALRLTPDEVAVKRELIATVSRVDPFVASVAPLFANLEVERYRPVPVDRDYTVPPPGLARYYDERGREVVSAGLHPRAITFGEHFVPLVRALGGIPTAKGA